MTDQLRILVGSDSAGVDYKDAIARGPAVETRASPSSTDLGVHAGRPGRQDVPERGDRGRDRIANGEADRAILFCGTGIGVAISANKVPGIRATVAHDSFSVERSILSNDCQVLTMGQRVIGLQLARRLAAEWLTYTFDPTSHSQANVAEIEAFEAVRS